MNDTISIRIGDEVGVTAQSELEHFAELFNAGNITTDKLREFNQENDFK